MNANEATTILFILSIAGAVLNALVKTVPVEYVALIALALGILSEVTNYIKSGYADKTANEPVVSEPEPEDGC